MREVRKKKIGILGGSFDPIHHGHIRLAQAARTFLSLGQVIFVPTRISPFKKTQPSLPAPDRLKIVRMALSKFPWAFVSDYEVKRKEISYTIDTLRHLRRKLGKNAVFYLLLGADSYKQLHRWKSFQKILQLTQIAVANRKGPRARNTQMPYLRIPMKEIEISSSQIRDQLKKGRLDQVKRWVPKAIVQVVQKKYS